MGLLPKTKELAVRLFDQAFALHRRCSTFDVKVTAVTILFIAAKVG